MKRLHETFGRMQPLFAFRGGAIVRSGEVGLIDSILEC